MSVPFRAFVCDYPLILFLYQSRCVLGSIGQWCGVNLFLLPDVQFLSGNCPWWHCSLWIVIFCCYSEDTILKVFSTWKSFIASPTFANLCLVCCSSTVLCAKSVCNGNCKLIVLYLMRLFTTNVCMSTSSITFHIWSDYCVARCSTISVGLCCVLLECSCSYGFFCHKMENIIHIVT